jgi:hypothetical protein
MKHPGRRLTPTGPTTGPEFKGKLYILVVASKRWIE